MMRRPFHRVNRPSPTSFVSTRTGVSTRRAISTTIAPVTLALVVALTSGCGVDLLDDQSGLDALTRVRPRVVIDGLVELSGRTDGRLFVDEVVIHAGRTELRNRTGQLTDLLASDPSAHGPLVFRYKLGHSAASSTSCGVERDWDLTSGDTASDLVFGFAPYSSDDHADPSGLGALDDVELSSLEGATAVVHGFVSVPSTSEGTPTFVATSDTNVQGGDPDGAPGKTNGDAFGGDPDGAPGKTGGDTFGGDPDGAPGRSTGDATNEGGDPDGAPGRSAGDSSPTQSAGGDPDGAPGDTAPDKIGPSLDETVAGGDPDGAPGRTHASASAGPGLPNGSGSQFVSPSMNSSSRMNDTLVPFVLLIDEEFSLHIPFASLGAAGRDQVLPIDVHVDAQHLFTTELLRILTQRATDHDSSSDESVTLSVESKSNLFEVTVAPPLTSTPSTIDPSNVDPQKLTVSSDPRDDETAQDR